MIKKKRCSSHNSKQFDKWEKDNQVSSEIYFFKNLDTKIEIIYIALLLLWLLTFGSLEKQW